MFEKLSIEHMSTLTPLKALMQSLLDLTRVRDSLALDPALLTLMQQWMGAFAPQAAPVRMQVLSRRQLVSVLDPQLTSADPMFDAWPVDVYNQLLQDVSLGHRQYTCLETSIGKLHVFPLKQSIAHKNALLLIQHADLSSEAISLIELCLQMFHHYASLIIENERDALTGLLNRKTFDQCVSKILLNDYKPEFRFPLHHYLVIFDIDFFKRINDSYGHLIGDEVLLLLSRLMQETFRDGDLLFRFGGEEFVGLFSCAEEADIVLLLDRFKDSLASYRFPQVGQMTISIGCAEMRQNMLPNTILERADEALYYAKEHGRNQIRYYETLLSQGLLQATEIRSDIELF